MLTNCLAACAHLTITVSEIERDIGENNGRKAGFFIPPCIWRPRLGGSRRNIGTPFGTEKTRMVSLPDGKKISKTRLFVLTWRTDGQTLRDSKDRAFKARPIFGGCAIRPHYRIVCLVQNPSSSRYSLEMPNFSTLDEPKATATKLVTSCAICYVIS